MNEMNSSNAIPLIIPEAAPDDSFQGPEFTTYGNNNAEKKESPICTACGKVVSLFLTNHSVLPHPVLKVLICDQCNNFYHSGQFTRDSQGIDEHCQWCGEGGNLLLCDICPHAFCNYCIKRNFPKKEFETIRDSEEWQCFVCNDEPLKNLVKKCKEICRKQSAYFSRTNSVLNEGLLERGSVSDSLPEVNKRNDEAISPIKNGQDSILTPDSLSNDDGKLIVTPITILRDKETYVVRSKSRSPPCADKIKLVLRHHSDPENSQEFADFSKKAGSWSKTPLNAQNVEPFEKEVNRTDPKDLLEKSMETDLAAPSGNKDVMSSNSSTNDSEFKLSSLDENSDTSITDYKSAVMSKSTSAEEKEVNPWGDVDETLTNVEPNIDQEIIDSATSTSGLSNESNLGKFQLKMKEAEEYISGLSRIFEELSSCLILNNHSGEHANPARSPSQYLQYRSTAKFLKTVKTLQTKLSGVEEELRVHKQRLGAKRLNHKASSSENDSDENDLDREKENNTWMKMKKSTSKSDDSPEKLSLPEEVAPTIEGHISKSSADYPDEDDRESAANDRIYDAMVPDADDQDEDEDDQDQDSAANDKIYDAKVVLKKLSQKDILKFARKPSKHHTVSDADDTDSSKATFRSKPIKSSSESSDNFSDDSRENFRLSRKIRPPKKQPKSTSKEDTCVADTAASQKTKNNTLEKKKPVLEESSDEDSLDSDATEFNFSLNPPDKLGVDQSMEDNDIAINLLLKKMEEDSMNEKDSDVDELLGKNKADKPTVKENEGNAVSNDGKSKKEEEESGGEQAEVEAEKPSKYRHPLLNVRFFSLHSGTQSRSIFLFRKGLIFLMIKNTRRTRKTLPRKEEQAIMGWIRTTIRLFHVPLYFFIEAMLKYCIAILLPTTNPLFPNLCLLASFKVC